MRSPGSANVVSTARLARYPLEKYSARSVPLNVANARSTAAKAYEGGKMERTVLIEFDSVEQAAAVHDSPAYQTALAALGDGAVRDLRIVPGV